MSKTVYNHHYSRLQTSGGSSAGDVISPTGGSTDNALVRFDGTTGQRIQDSLITISDTGDIENITGLGLISSATNPGDDNTLWIRTSDGHILRGAIDLEETGTGDVVGPASATDNAIPLYDTTSGKLVKNSTAIFKDVNTSFNITSNDIPDNKFLGGNVLFGRNILTNPPNSINRCVIIGNDILHTGATILDSMEDCVYVGNDIAGGNGGAVLTKSTIVGCKMISWNGSNYCTFMGYNSAMKGSYNVCIGFMNIHPAGTGVSNGNIYIGDPTFTNNSCHISAIYNKSSTTSPKMMVIGSDNLLGTLDIPTGDVIAPISSTDNAIARFDATTGKLLQDGIVTQTDTGTLQNIESLDLTTAVANPGTANTLWQQTSDGHLYRGSVDLEDSGLKAPIITTPNLLPTFDSTDGSLVKSSGIRLEASTRGYSMGVGTHPGLTSAADNYLQGYLTFTDISTGYENICWGTQILDGMSPGTSSQNVIIGNYSCQNGNFNNVRNVVIGNRSATGASSMTDCTILGHGSGTNAINNTNCVYIDNAGAAENNTIRIGSGHSACYISGIKDVTPVGTNEMVIIDENNQLGSIAIPTGDVTGAVSSTDNAVVRFDGTTGKIIQDSSVTISDGGSVTIPGSLFVNNINDISFNSVNIEGTKFKNNSIDLTLSASNPGGGNSFWQRAVDGHLFRGSVDLENSGGDVDGPISSTDDNMVLFSGTTGKIIKDSGILVNTANTSIIMQTNVGAETYGNNNVIMGYSAMPTGTANTINNVALGSNILTGTISATANINSNVLIGSSCCTNASVDTNAFRRNTIIGNQTCFNVFSTSVASFQSNIIIGDLAGFNLTTGEYNILIGNEGVVGDNNTIRIGNEDLGTAHTRCFIAGIHNKTPGGTLKTVVIDQDDQLGTTDLQVIAYGEMDIEDNVTATVITASSTDFSNKVLVNIWGTSITNNVTATPASGIFTIGSTGSYKVFVSMSLTGGTNDTYSFGFYQNAVTRVGTKAKRRFSSGDIGSMSFSSIVALTSGDTLALYVQNETSTANTTIEDGSFSLHKIN